MKHKSITNYKYRLKIFCFQIDCFYLFINYETDTDFIISLFNEFHIYPLD